MVAGSDLRDARRVPDPQSSDLAVLSRSSAPRIRTSNLYRVAMPYGATGPVNCGSADSVPVEPFKA
jgi:hypothetical protein